MNYFLIGLIFCAISMCMCRLKYVATVEKKHLFEVLHFDGENENTKPKTWIDAHNDCEEHKYKINILH
jgi:hypothetical protein